MGYYHNIKNGGHNMLSNAPPNVIKNANAPNVVKNIKATNQRYAILE